VSKGLKSRHLNKAAFLLPYILGISYCFQKLIGCSVELIGFVSHQCKNCSAECHRSATTYLPTNLHIVPSSAVKQTPGVIHLPWIQPTVISTR
jgi:hypothetical protein